MGIYIGVTGFKSIDEIQTVYKLVAAIGGSRHRGDIGYGFVYCLRKEKGSLPLTRVRSLSHFIEGLTDNCKSIVHMNNWEQILHSQMQALELHRAIPNSTVVQVNKFDWTESSFKLLKEVFPGRRFILPINPNRVRAIDCLPLVQTNLECIDTVLIDSSEGRGELLNIDQVSDIAAKFRANCTSVAIGVAGGLGKELSEQAASRLYRLMPVSVDAETGLREDGVLAVESTRNYLSRMMEINQQ